MEMAFPTYTFFLHSCSLVGTSKYLFNRKELENEQDELSKKTQLENSHQFSFLKKGYFSAVICCLKEGEEDEVELSGGLHCSYLQHEDKTEAYTLYVIRQQRGGIFTVWSVGANQN